MAHIQNPVPISHLQEFTDKFKQKNLWWILKRQRNLKSKLLPSISLFFLTFFLQETGVMSLPRSPCFTTDLFLESDRFGCSGLKLVILVIVKVNKLQLQLRFYSNKKDV